MVLNQQLCTPVDQTQKTRKSKDKSGSEFRSSEDGKEVRWLTMVRTRVREYGSAPQDKLMWVGFVD